MYIVVMEVTENINCEINEFKYFLEDFICLCSVVLQSKENSLLS